MDDRDLALELSMCWRMAMKCSTPLARMNYTGDDEDNERAWPIETPPTRAKVARFEYFAKKTIRKSR